MNLYNLFKKVGFLLLLVTLFAFTANAQGLSTVYVDVTNGLVSNTGANPDNSVAGLGPKATINGGLSALANNGTLVIFAGTYNGGDAAGGNVNIATGTYGNLVAGGSITIEVRKLGGDNNVLLSAGTFTYNVDGGTLNIATTNGTEFFTLNAGGLTLGSGTNSTMNIPNATFFRISSNQTITLHGTSNFSNQAPQKGTNISLSYLGDGNVTAGPESNYASYGTGTITVNKTAGTKVSFPNAITSVGGIVITSGDASFSNSVDVGTSDITNNGTGTLTFDGSLGLSVGDGTADGNLGSIENASTGTITANGAVTWTGGTLAANRTFASGANTYVIDNQSTGTVNLAGAVNLVASDANGNSSFTFTATNGAAGTLTIGSVTANASSSNGNTGNLVLITGAAAGTVNLTGGNYRGTINNAAGHTINVNGALTVGTDLTNAGTVTANAAVSVAGKLTNSSNIALGTNSLTLSGNSAHATNGGTITATTGGVVVSASGNNSFNGGTLSNVTINGAGNTTFQTNAVAVTNLTVSSGTATVSVATTASGTTTVNGGTLNVGSVALTTNDFSQTSGTFALANNSSSILDVNGNFTRTTGTFTTGAASVVKFTGAAAQSVNGGSLWTVANLTFTNTGGTITLGNSVRINGTATISTNTNLNLGTLNIILFANNAKIVNSGSYSASGSGGIIFGGVNSVAGAGANYTGQKIEGSGLYSFITIDVGTSNAVTADVTGDNVKFTGVLTLRSGDLDVNDGALGGGPDLAPSGTSAKIIRFLGAGGSTNGVNVNTSNATFNTNVPTDYDLEYMGSIGTSDVTVTVGTNEFDAARVRNLTFSHNSDNTNTEVVLSSGSAVTIKGNLTVNSPPSGKFADFSLPAQNLTINGTLVVNEGAEISVGNSSKPITLDGDNKTHTIAGKITAAGVLTITGNNVTLNGSTTSTSAAQVNSVAFEPANANYNFTSTNLKVISGNLTLQGSSTKTGATASVTMNATDATLTGNLTVGNGTIGPGASFNMPGATTNTFGGNLVLTNGTLTLTRGATTALSTINGTATLTAGTLTLGSNVTIKGATTQAAGNIDAGGFRYVQLGSAAANDYNRTGAGTFTNGTLSLNSTAAPLKLVPGTTFDVPNLEAVGTANGVTVSASMTVSNSLLLDNAGTFAQTGVLTVSGPTVTVTSDAGAFTGALTLTNAAATATLAQDYAFPTLVINSAGTVTVATDDNVTPSPRKLAVGTAFTLTKGILAMGINHLIVTTAFTYTAGSITQTSGFLRMNVAVPSMGTGFAIDNFDVLGNLSVAVAKEKFTVNKYLLLSGGSITTFADGDLTLGDGATVERQGNGLTLVKVPTFGTTTNLLYSTAGTITTAKEVPASGLNNVTVKVNTTLGGAMTVNGTLTLTSGTFTSSSTNEVTIAGGGTIVRTAGAMARAPLATSYNLTYNGGATTEGLEYVPGKVANLTISLTGGANFTLGQNFTITGNFSLSPAAAGSQVDLNGNKLAVPGDVTITSNGNFTNGNATTSQLTFSGAAAQTFTVPTAGLQIPAAASTGGIELVLNNTVTAGVTLTGGNLTMANIPAAANTSIVRFINGVLKTGTNVVTLWQANANNQPLQGFDRTGVDIANGKYSHVVGNVKKFVSKNATVDITQVIFPVGTLPTSPGNYRPLSIFFKTTPQSSVNLTVSEVDSSPGGANGIPLNTGTFSITNYPNFFWYVKSDQALAPSYKYDMELQAQGYTDYVKDGIQNIRMIRRDSGNVSNQWVMQGTNTSYDNSTINSSWPVLKVIDATGGITTQGSRFTYSQNNKPPVFTAALGDTTIAEGDSVSFTYTATDPDIGQTATLSAVTLPTGATFDAATGVFNWVTSYTSSGANTVTIRASDGTDNTDTTVTVTVTNVNRNPQFVNVPAGTTSVAEGAVYNFTITASDPDGTTSFTYSLVAPADSVSIVDSTGELSIDPAFGDAGNIVNYTVRVADGNGGTADTTLTYKVTNTNRAPVFATAMADTSVDEAATLTLDFGANSSDPDGDALTYTFTLKKGGVAAADSGAIVSGTGVYTWTPKYTQAGVYELVVTASDGTLSASDTVAVTVNNKNAAPTWATGGELATQTIFVGDTLRQTYKADDLDNDAITYAFVGPHPNDATLNTSTGAFSWAPTTATQFPVVITVSASDGIATAIQTSATITVNEATLTVSGTVTYENTSNTPIVGAVVKLMDGTTVAGTSTTTTTGAYSFTGVAGFKTYTLSVSKTTGWPSSAVLASDALLTARSSVDPSVTLSALQTLAADVTGEGNVTAADALQILRRVVGSISSFTISDWQFETKTITVSGANKTVNLKGIAAGDVNESATTLPKKSKVTVISGKNIKISPNSEFKLPVTLNAAQKVGAFTLRFTYPVQMMTFKSVKSNVGVISYAKNGKISVAWAKMPGEKSLKDGETPSVILVFKATKAFAKSTSAGLTLTNGEIVNAIGKNMADASVNMSQAEVAIPSVFALSQNYPNPFNPSTIIEYQLPVKGNVTLTIYNTLGQVVKTLINNQVVEAGSYKARWNATNLASGIYFYSLRVEGTKGFLKTKKMILLK